MECGSFERSVMMAVCDKSFSPKIVKRVLHNIPDVTSLSKFSCPNQQSQSKYSSFIIINNKESHKSSHIRLFCPRNDQIDDQNSQQSIILLISAALVRKS